MARYPLSHFKEKKKCPVTKGNTYLQVPGGGAFSDITDAAFKGFRAVSEGAYATIPKAFICGRFRLSFWPSEEWGVSRGRNGKGRDRSRKNGETANHKRW